VTLKSFVKSLTGVNFEKKEDLAKLVPQVKKGLELLENEIKKPETPSSTSSI